MKLRYYIIIFSLIASLTACSDQAEENTRESIFTVKEQPYSNALYYSGILKPLHLINVPSPSDGVVVGINFEYGQSVKKGAVLVKVNSDQLEKEYNTALTDYLGAKDKLETASSKYKSSKELFQLGIISEENFKSDKSEYDNSNMNYLRALYSLKDTLKTAHGSFTRIKNLKISNLAEVDKALRVKYNNLTITSNGTGVALAPPKASTNDDDGKIMLGSEVKRGQILLSVGDLDGVSIDININELDIDRIKAGTKVAVSGVAFPGLALQGYVKSVDSQASASNSYTGGLPSFKATVIVPKLSDAEKKNIRVGMSAKIKINSPEKKMIMIPTASVFQKRGKSWVVQLNNDREKEVAVKTGVSSFDKVEIVQGLKVGDKILVTEEAIS